MTRFSTKNAKWIALVLATASIVALIINVSADSDSDIKAAVDYLVQEKVFIGDQNGQLNLDKGLTRAELATLVWRLKVTKVGNEYKDSDGITLTMVDEARRKGELGFTDVPDWAGLPVMYCKMKGIVNGYSATKFGSSDMVTAKQLCTIALRFVIGDQEGATWTYDTAIAKAISTDIAPDYTEDTPSIARGDVAVILYRIVKPDMIPHGVIDVRTAPYQDGSLGYTATGVAILPKGSDHSRQVSDVLFKDEGTTAYTREFYNLLREAYLGYLNTGNLKETEIEFEHLEFDSKTDTNLLLEQTPGWNLFGSVGDRSSSRTNGKNIPHITVYPPAFGVGVELNSEATKIKNEFISSLAGLSDMDKVVKIDQYIQDHMEYGTDGLDYKNRFFTSSAEGLCMQYATIANLLFYEADIPIFAISGGINGKTTNHAVNFIYIDGKWQYYDSTIGDTDGKSQYYQLLFGDAGRQKTKFAFENERFAQFMMEAIMPRSIYR